MGTSLKLKGKKFFRLTPLRRLRLDHHSQWVWSFRCDCGKRVTAPATRVQLGHTRSCGCFQREQAKRYRTIHGKCNTVEYRLFQGALSRAKRDGLPFSLRLNDIVIPPVCPLLGINLFVRKGFLTPNSPTLDRINMNKGYTKRNSWVISHRANTIKSNASFKEI